MEKNRKYLALVEKSLKILLKDFDDQIKDVSHQDMLIASAMRRAHDLIERGTDIISEINGGKIK